MPRKTKTESKMFNIDNVDTNALCKKKNMMCSIESVENQSSTY